MTHPFGTHAPSEAMRNAVGPSQRASDLAHLDAEIARADSFAKLLLADRGQPKWEEHRDALVRVRDALTIISFTEVRRLAERPLPWELAKGGTAKGN